jgi:FkbM family methyltransferase
MTLNNNSLLLKKIIPPNYLYKQGSFRYVKRDDINYKLDISNVVDHYLYFGFKDSSYDSIIEEIKKSKIILDVGANIGITALYYASINTKAQIFAFEPHPETFKRANDNIELNKFKNIHLFNIGLAQKKESLKLYEVNQKNPGMNRILSDYKNLPFKRINVEILDQFCLENNISKIDFIKIDVEGFEYFVLLGGGEVIQKSKPILFIELDDNNLRENNKSAKELIDLLKKFGYKEFCRADNLMPVSIQMNFDNCHFNIIVK